ncbi:hypothetical protein B0H19DRAFT_1071680 [Mycena capillaripes]|nr:hypothetical protein B0H19DRAFT_1071680 [Mycena capillaripes]
MLLCSRWRGFNGCKKKGAKSKEQTKKERGSKKGRKKESKGIKKGWKKGTVNNPNERLGLSHRELQHMVFIFLVFSDRADVEWIWSLRRVGLDSDYLEPPKKWECLFKSLSKLPS